MSQNLLKSQVDFGTQPGCNYHESGCLPHQCVEWNLNGSCKRHEMMDGSPLSPIVCGYSQDCAEFSKIFISNLKIIKTCDKKAYQKGCISDYKGLDDSHRESNPDISDYDLQVATSGSIGWTKSWIQNTSIAYVLEDGCVLLSYDYPFSTKLFAVDINGKKGPNKWGYDIFGFNTNGVTGKGIKFGGGGFSEKGGVSTAQMIKDMHK